MANPEWGTKRQCPKCGERFYDLNKPFPLACIECGHAFEPEMVLKSKQPLPEDEPKIRKVAKAPAADEEADEGLLDDDMDLDDEGDTDLLADVDDIDGEDDMDDVLSDRPGDE